MEEFKDLLEARRKKLQQIKKSTGRKSANLQKW